MMAFTIAGRELRSLFLSPMAWAILAVVSGICAWFFLSYLDFFLQIQPRLAAVPGGPGAADIVVAPLFSTAATVLLLVVPLLTMRLISEERRAQTLPLLLSAPVSMTEIVLGKFLGVLGFVLVMLLLIAAMPLSLLAGGTLDLGLWAAGVLGLLLLLDADCAAGGGGGEYLWPAAVAVDSQPRRHGCGQQGPARLPVADEPFSAPATWYLQQHRYRLLPVAHRYLSSAERG